MTDFLINDPELTKAYVVKGAESAEEAAKAAVDAEPRYYQSVQGALLYTTDLEENPEALTRSAESLDEPVVLDLGE